MDRSTGLWNHRTIEKLGLWSPWQPHPSSSSSSSWPFFVFNPKPTNTKVRKRHSLTWGVTVETRGISEPLYVLVHPVSIVPHLRSVLLRIPRIWRHHANLTDCCCSLPWSLVRPPAAQLSLLFSTQAIIRHWKFLYIFFCAKLEKVPITAHYTQFPISLEKFKLLSNAVVIGDEVIIITW